MITLGAVAVLKEIKYYERTLRRERIMHRRVIKMGNSNDSKKIAWYALAFMGFAGLV